LLCVKLSHDKWHKAAVIVSLSCHLRTTCCSLIVLNIHW